MIINLINSRILQDEQDKQDKQDNSYIFRILQFKFSDSDFDFKSCIS